MQLMNLNSVNLIGIFIFVCSIFFSISGKAIEIRHLATKQHQLPTTRGKIFSACFSPDDRIVAMSLVDDQNASNHHMINVATYIVDATTFAPLGKVATGSYSPFFVPNYNIAFSPDGSHLYVSYYDEQKRGVLDVIENKHPYNKFTSIKLKNSPKTMHVNKGDGTIYIGSYKGSFSKVNPQTYVLEELFTVKDQPAPGYWYTFNSIVSMHKQIFAGSSDGFVRIFELEQEAWPRQFAPATNCASVFKLGVDEKKRHLFTYTDDGVLRQWDIAQRKLLEEYQWEHTHDFVFNARNRLVFASSQVSRHLKSPRILELDNFSELFDFASIPNYPQLPAEAKFAVANNGLHILEFNPNYRSPYRGLVSTRFELVD